jgi:hypothetical protein
MATLRGLVTIAAWVLFINGLVYVFLPVIVGLATGNLVGAINSVDAGVLWFWRHGYSFLLGAIFLSASVYAVRMRTSLE